MPLAVIKSYGLNMVAFCKKLVEKGCGIKPAREYQYRFDLITTIFAPWPRFKL
jgi:hypothetical protein